MDSLKLGVSGARGIVGESLDPIVTVRLAAAFGAPLAGRTVLVGGDTRRTGPMVRHSLFGGLTGVGCDVLDCGICPTPSILLALSRRELGGGILVTASHNPIEWNALKFVSGEGFFLGPGEGEALARRFHAGETGFVSHDRVGTVEPGPDVEEEHLDAVLHMPWLDVKRVRKRKWKVVVDGVGGAGIRLAPALLERLGCEVEAIHCEDTGSFPRPPEPKPENLGDLCDRVRESGADAGFALDPDGDRLSLVGPGGEPISEEHTVAIVTAYVLSRRPGPVVINLSTSRTTEELAERCGVPVYRTPVGEAHVAAEMVSKKAVIGGEGNGGVMVPALHPMRDAAAGIALVLQAMTDGGKSLGELDGELPRYVLLKRIVSADSLNEDAFSAALRSRFGDAEEDRRDGLRLSWGRKWVHIRPSNTEPVVRLFAEAPEEGEAREIQEAAAHAVGGSSRPVGRGEE